MPFDPNVHVGCAAWIERAGGILMMKRGFTSHGGGLWALPGGWVDYREDPADSVVREVREELGLTVLRTSLMSVVSNTWTPPDGPGTAVCVTYRTTIADDDEPVIMEPEKCSELIWASPRDIGSFYRENLLFPATKSVLDQMSGRLIQALNNLLPNAWMAGDPCGTCGSTNTTEDIVEGGHCNDCGASDADE